MSLYRIVRPLVFSLPPEEAHRLTLALLRLAGGFAPLRGLLSRAFAPRQPGPAVEAFGLTFRNPLGLAAGYDKDGLAWRGLACLGFGHLELGTVTPRPQAGNPKPRVFRLAAEQAVINRMGFPGRGADFLARHLRGSRPDGLVLGVNIGKNRDTPLESAVDDYLTLLRIFAPLADYLAVNVSSPNTPGLRSLQTRPALEEVLAPLAVERRELEGKLGRRIPLLVKVSPDLSWGELDDAIGVILAAGIDGVIATNTTTERTGIHSPLAAESGGLSGAPLRERSTQIVRWIAAHTQGRLPVIASGGVMGARDVLEKLEAGACLVQMYTGLIFGGPGLVKQALEGLNFPPSSSASHDQEIQG